MRRRTIAIGVAIIFFSLSAVILALPYIRRTQTNRSEECRQGDVMAGVYRPNRLVIHNACVTVTGVVRQIFHANDGDYHINLDVEQVFAYLLNEGNRNKVCGWLVVEVTPYDQERGVYIPKSGERVSVTGAWVYDSNHGWNEIHPAWKIIKLAEATREPVAPCAFQLPS